MITVLPFDAGTARINEQELAQKKKMFSVNHGSGRGGVGNIWGIFFGGGLFFLEEGEKTWDSMGWDSQGN